MPTTDSILEKETHKWLKKLEKETVTLNPEDQKTKEAIENMRAYIKDCKHFLKEKDLVRAFEAVIYAWGIYETLLRMDLV